MKRNQSKVGKDNYFSLVSLLTVTKRVVHCAHFLSLFSAVFVEANIPALLWLVMRWKIKTEIVFFSDFSILISNSYGSSKRSDNLLRISPLPGHDLSQCPALCDSNIILACNSPRIFLSEERITVGKPSALISKTSSRFEMRSHYDSGMTFCFAELISTP